jgi:Domain of unknown function (DUF5668)/Cell wall-active antibiotics response 4TMS YvqF
MLGAGPGREGAMDGRGGVQNMPRLIFGLMVILIGVAFTLDRLGVMDAGHLFDYWPMLLIAWGLARVLQGREAHGFGFGVVVIIVGVWLLGENLGFLELRIRDFWPFLLILLGGLMVWRAVTGRSVTPWRHHHGPPPPPTPTELGGEPLPPRPSAATDEVGDPNDTVSGFAMLSGVVRRNSCKAFRGGDLTAVMGGCELDLRNAVPVAEGAVVETFAFMGGIEIVVPIDWQVVVEGVPFLGGYDDKTAHVGTDGRKRLTIRGAAVMGGVEIHN